MTKLPKKATKLLDHLFQMCLSKTNEINLDERYRIVSQNSRYLYSEDEIPVGNELEYVFSPDVIKKKYLTLHFTQTICDFGMDRLFSAEEDLKIFVAEKIDKSPDFVKKRKRNTTYVHSRERMNLN